MDKQRCFKTIPVTIDEMNAILSAHDNTPRLFSRPGKNDISSALYVLDGDVNFRVWCSFAGKTALYVARKDGTNAACDDGLGRTAYAQLARVWKKNAGYALPVFDHPEEIGSSAAFQSYRLDTDCTRISGCIGYDINSAYGWGASQPMPDTREIVGYNRIVLDGEMGFMLDDPAIPDGWKEPDIVGERLQMCKPGEPAEVIFRTIESPMTEFFNRWYDRKRHPRSKEEKAYAKKMIVCAVGYLQLKNPYLRAAVIGHCNRRIIDLIDEDTIYCNTDSLVSRRPRDFATGEEMGLFKIEHTGEFAHRRMNSQWNAEKPSARGQRLLAGSDILEDEIQAPNIVEYNKESNRLEKTDND